jgi:UDP-glucose-4-epimerase GalE
MKKTVVVTGAAGYIGGQTALMLADSGYRVVGIDKVECPKRLKSVLDDYIEQDFAHKDSLVKILIHAPEAIVHCAGTSLVGPSVQHPGRYFKNNVVNTLTLLDQVRKSMPKTRFIFSSSAAVYGEPIMTPCHEVDPCEPISPYGDSKLMVERIMAAYHTAYKLDYVAFRYFNACGADSKTRHGQTEDATHIIARVLEAIRDDKEFILNGVDYPTPDGTCVRDYVHVEDIARAHVMALDTEIPTGVYNLGSNNGTSNREIIAAAERITGQKLKVVMGEARPGDPAVLTASAAKFAMVGDMAWRQFELDDMIQHAWNWYVRKDS